MFVPALLLVLSVLIPLSPARASFGDDHGWEVLTIEGQPFPSELRVSPRELVLLRVRDGAPEPVPFQIDERDEAGRFALPDGPEPSHDEHPGIFDENDLLVFAARDLGRRAAVPDAVEIEITDPITRQSGWAYLRRRRDEPAATRQDVRYDAGTDTISASRYVLRFTPHTTSFFAFVDSDGKPGRNLLDRVKARISARLLLGLVAFHRNEDDVTNSVIAWKLGPIRLLRRSRIQVRVGYGLPAPQVIAENIFTADIFESPSTVHIPFDLRYVLGDLNLRTYMDFEDLHGYRIFTRGGEPVAIDCDLPAPHLDGVSTDWFGLTGPEGAFVHVLRLGPALRSVRRRLIARAERRPDPPERVAGNCPGVGYTLDHWEGIGRGTYWSDVVVRAFDHFKPGDEREFLYALDHPLEVSIHAPSGR